MVVIETDCRSEIGITVGLIDTLINTARILRERDLNSLEIKEAIKDLQQDEDIKYILNQDILSHIYNNEYIK